MVTRRYLPAFVLVFAALHTHQALLSAGPLPSDSRIVSGKLDSGLTWMYRRHDNPPGKMALIVHVRTGSLNETDAQQGGAHFIEHMSFNGSEHFAPGELIPYFESIGMEFGPDINAFTSFDETGYMLFLPDTEIEQVDKGLMVLSDYVFRLLLLEEEIDKERGVILEEARLGKNTFQRIRDKLWPELFEGSRFARRLPIGKEETIANIPRGELADYYRTWYRPENMTLVLVGDADLEPITPLIKKWFGEYRPTVPARPSMTPEFKPFTEQRAIVVTDPEMALCLVEMLNVGPKRPPTLSVEQWRVELVEYLGSWIMRRRHDERIRSGEASYRGAYVYVTDFFQDGILMFARATGEPADWAKMVSELVTEVKRAREHGFTERELALAKKEILSEAEHAVQTEPTQSARGILMDIAQAVNDRVPILSAQQELALLNELLPSIRLAKVSETFGEHFTPGTFAYVVTMPEKEGAAVPTRYEVLKTARSAWAQSVEGLLEQDRPTELVEGHLKPGKVVETAFHEDLGITSMWLENGIRVHHRFMDYKKDSVWISVSLAGGEIQETPLNAGVTEVALLAVNEAATERLTSSDVRDIMTGKNVSVSAQAEGDSLTIQLTGSPQDIEAGIQLVHALLTDGKIEEPAFKNWKQRTLQEIELTEKMPVFQAIKAMEDLLSGGDPRRSPMTREKVAAASIQSGQAWFDRLCRTAPIEVAVIGDIKLEKILPLIEQYIGSLGGRRRSTEELDRFRYLIRPIGPLASHMKVETMTPQGMVFAGFAGCEGRDADDTRALRLAANIMDSRLTKRIREEKSLVYTVGTDNYPSWIYQDAGRFVVWAPCAPEKVMTVAGEIHDMLQEFADTGPTAEELDNAKKQIANDLDEEMREPTYWFAILQHRDLHGRNLDEERAQKEAFERVPAEQIQSVFRKYYTRARRFQVTAVPVAPVSTKDEQKEPTPPKPST